VDARSYAVHNAVDMSAYQEFPSAGALARYIECAWVLSPGSSGNPAPLERILPDGATDIVIAAGEGTAVHAPAASFRLVPAGIARVGIRIRTGAAAIVLGCSPAELQSAAVPIRWLWGAPGAELEERLAAASHPALLAGLLKQALMRRLSDAADLDPVALGVVERLRRSPGIAVRTLARDAGLCDRHLRRRFQRHVGMSIKRYARIVRFQSLLDTVRRQRRGALSPRWAALACDHGYADQAHLIREVRALAGLTPGELLQRL
jgi:AraC-like DNA-binding protein